MEELVVHTKRIIKFFRKKNKLSMLKNKLLMILQQIFRKKQFGTFGENSIIRLPDRIIGSKHIFIEDNVSILKHARMEAISEYNGQVFTPQIHIGKKTSIGQNLHVVACNNLR